jgi:glycine betaine catabolism A
MNEHSPSVSSPRLDHCPPGLPSSFYYDEGRFKAEMSAIWATNWVYVGRVSSLEVMTLKRVHVAGSNLFLVKASDGQVRAFYNACQHRGSELCPTEARELNGRLITCPYHAWAYDVTGRLISTAFARPTADFDKSQHGLRPVNLREWNGFLFVCLADAPPDFDSIPDIGPRAFDNWPMQDLVVGHRHQVELASNWKVFWENYNECLHCPGIHPMLSDFVPIYSKGVMAANEAHDWSPDAAMPTHNLKTGARSWTMNGQPCGAEFANLTKAERDAGYVFGTLLPTMFVVAHADYVRCVSMTPISAEKTRLDVEWLFLPATLAAADFDRGNVIDFASTVLGEDAAACEMNQRGLRGLQTATLMPEEYELHRFHGWIRSHLPD